MATNSSVIPDLITPRGQPREFRESQKNVSLAQRDELKTITEYNKMLVLWEKTTGTALERFHIDL
jgi:hypothetical protein